MLKAARRALDLDELIDQTVPKSIRQAKPLILGKPLAEHELLARMRRWRRRTR
jgi:glycine dehydrogenase